jgi:ribosome-associated protein
LDISPTLSIPDDALSYRFVRSSGPGGQHVNKVSTAVELRLDLDRSGLPRQLQNRILKISGQRATSRREVIIFAQRFRSQARNRSDAEDRLRDLLQQALHRHKARIATRAGRGVRRRRLETKRRRGTLKRSRGPADAET